MTIHRHEPVWRPRRQIRHSQVPEIWQSWLYDDESLTARLKSGCVQPFRVEVLKQRYARVQLNEAKALDMPERQYALLREVYL